MQINYEIIMTMVLYAKVDLPNNSFVLPPRITLQTGSLDVVPHALGGGLALVSGAGGGVQSGKNL